jgi:hypothetical protein
MISYLTKQFQAVPALMAIYQEVGGEFVTTRSTTKYAILDYQPVTSVSTYIEKLGPFSKGYKKLKDSQVIVTGAPYQTLLSRFNAKKYMIFTGTSPSLTPKFLRDNHAHFDKLCALGPRMIRTIERSGLDVDVMQTGYFPFLMFPERQSITSRAALTLAGLDLSKKTILYTPRGEPFGSFDIMMPKLLKAFEGQSYNLIVRPHPSQSVKLHWRDKLKFFLMKKELSHRDNIFLDLNYFKLSDLLAVVDLLISDGNSPAEEGLFYELPQILVETNRLSRLTITQKMSAAGANQEDIDLALAIYNNGPVLDTSTENVMDFIEKSIADGSQYHAARNANFEFVFGSRTFENQCVLLNELRKYQN